MNIVEDDLEEGKLKGKDVCKNYIYLLDYLQKPSGSRVARRKTIHETEC
jgi:hypothetical protein